MAMSFVFDTLAVRKEGAVLYAEISAPPMSGGGKVAGGIQHLTRLMGRGRALEVMLSAQDYDAELAERYGWINRALPAAALNDFVTSLAQRIASFPSAGRAPVKERVDAIALAPMEYFRHDSDLFGDSAQGQQAQARIRAAMARGFQTRESE